jgi:hypothetical protein
MDMRETSIQFMSSVFEIVFERHGISESDPIANHYAMASKANDFGLNIYNMLYQPHDSFVKLGIRDEWMETLIEVTESKLNDIDGLIDKHVK